MEIIRNGFCCRCSSTLAPTTRKKRKERKERKRPKFLSWARQLLQRARNAFPQTRPAVCQRNSTNSWSFHQLPCPIFPSLIANSYHQTRLHTTANVKGKSCVTYRPKLYNIKGRDNLECHLTLSCSSARWWSRRFIEPDCATSRLLVDLLVWCRRHATLKLPDMGNFFFFELARLTLLLLLMLCCARIGKEIGPGDKGESTCSCQSSGVVN